MPRHPAPGGLTMSDDLSLGGWIHLDSALSIEIMARAGFDWCCLDTQHGTVQTASLVQAMNVLENAGVPVWVRIQTGQHAQASWALDMGADAVVVPQVGSAAYAREVLAHCLYPPRGQRSWGPTRAKLRAHRPGPRTWLMIEDVAGIEAVEEICALDGVDGIFVGPADLAQSIGGDPAATTAPATLDAARRVADACRRHGVEPAVFCGSAQALPTWAGLGFRTMALAADSALLAGAATDALARARDVTRG